MEFLREAGITDELKDPSNRMILLVGAADSGKTTMVASLAAFLAGNGSTCIVDLDMGQSHIGPPTTIGWGRVGREFRDWPDIVVEDFYFTGTVSPVGNLLPALTGAKLISDKALASCGKVIVDTTGLIAEPAGRVLKQFKIDLLSPDIVLGLEHSGELDQILGFFRFHRRPKIVRLQIPPEVEAKSVQKRSLYRFEQISSYLKDARNIEVATDDIGVRSAAGRPEFSDDSLRNRIVSFRDGQNRDIALGVIEEVIPCSRTLVVRTPLEEGTPYTGIVIGRTEVDSTDKQVRDVPLRSRENPT
ncbi:MAG TPA: Clp1/GlmU family protein [Thermodesulfovibrionales bacterium]|nr:Clp1/GlmU family protein [Thermodesulfovibrionales bacterium]